MLNSALPQVTQDLSINGGAANLAISGANLYRVFDLGPQVVNLSNLSIINGSAENGPDIDMIGTTLTLTNIRIAANQAHFYGAIHQFGGTLTVVKSSFLGNAGSYTSAIGLNKGSAFISNTTLTPTTAMVEAFAMSTESSTCGIPSLPDTSIHSTMPALARYNQLVQERSPHHNIVSLAEMTAALALSTGATAIGWARREVPSIRCSERSPITGVRPRRVRSWQVVRRAMRAIHFLRVVADSPVRVLTSAA